MRLLLIVVGALLALNVVVWVFNPTPGTNYPAPHMITSVAQLKAELEAGKSRVASVNTGLSGSPYEDVEYSRMNLRRRTREGMFEVFRAPWSSFCTEQGHQRLRDAISYYFDHRLNQQRIYKSARGSEGLAEGKAKWATFHDQLIEQWTRETFRRSNFTLADLSETNARGVAEIVGDERPASSPDCTDRAEPVTRPTTLVELPWTAHERRQQQERDHVRLAALSFLNQPRTALCETAKQGQPNGDLSRYFDLQGEQRRLYSSRDWGEAAERYLAESWGTPDDKQIVQRIREAVAGGYLTAAAVRPGAQLLFKSTLRGIQPGASVCTG